MSFNQNKNVQEILQNELNQLKEENARLKQILQEHHIDYELSDDESIVQVAEEQQVLDRPQPRLSLEEKVALFRSLFKGREDVYARRWYSVTSGKSGYQPVCEREWNSSFCNKKKYKCAECPNRSFAPLSYEALFRHLSGKDEWCRDVLGIYAILEDDTCYFLCTDFDDKNCEHGYQTDVHAFINVCRDWSIPAYIERSRSGKGAHVWIFFEKNISAAKARRLGNIILTEAMNRDGHLSFKSYDRFFPNQDTLPKGGFGNLVALPLQGNARRAGNTVFVDEKFSPYPDQWNFLISVHRLPELSIDLILKDHYQENQLGELSKTSESKPWQVPADTNLVKNDFPSRVTLIKSNQLYLNLNDYSPKLISHFKRLAAFRNPEYYAKQGMRLPLYNIPRIISCSEIVDHYLKLPRGCEDAVTELLMKNQVRVNVVDKTNPGCEIQVSFKGNLRKEQEEAMKEMLQYNIGTLSATTAFGKTVFAIAMIAERKVNTLILVHTKALLEQWVERLETFLQIESPIMQETKKKRKPFSPIGCLYSGKNTLHGIVDIALIQSSIEKGEVKPFIHDYGMVIVDECHHVSAVNFEQVLKEVHARYVYGLTATPIRKDGHQPIIFMQCGPIRYIADTELQMKNQSFDRVLVPRFTSYRNLTDDEKTYTQLIQDLSSDSMRNQLIVQDILSALSEGRTPLVLSNLTSHVQYLSEQLSLKVPNVITLIGADSSKNKRVIMERLKQISPNERLVIVATGKYVGEGFDYPRLDTLFLTMPVSWKGLVAQYAGRLHRDYPGKKVVRIYDYVDIRISLCDLMYRKRLKGYSAVGYKTVSKDNSDVKYTDMILDGANYWNILKQDLVSSKQSIVISCPKIKMYRSMLLDMLRDLRLSGIEIVIHTERKSNDILANYGLNIITHEHLSLQCLIIDKQKLWYGNVNFLGYNSSDNNVMRMQNSSLSKELIEALYE